MKNNPTIAILTIAILAMLLVASEAFGSGTAAMNSGSSCAWGKIIVLNTERASQDSNIDYRHCGIIDDNKPSLVKIINTPTQTCLKVSDDVGIKQIAGFTRFNYTNYYCTQDYNPYNTITIEDFAGNKTTL